MLAYRLLKEQTQPEFQEVPEPHGEKTKCQPQRFLRSK